MSVSSCSSCWHAWSIPRNSAWSHWRGYSSNSCNSYPNGGIAEAVIQTENLSEEKASSAFWANLATGLIFVLVSAAASWALERIFDTPDLGTVIRQLSLTFLIVPLGSVHLARLAREFGFKALAIRNILSVVISGAAGILIAYEGGGAEALVAPTDRGGPRDNGHGLGCLPVVAQANLATGQN